MGANEKGLSNSVTNLFNWLKHKTDAKGSVSLHTIMWTCHYTHINTKIKSVKSISIHCFLTALKNKHMSRWRRNTEADSIVTLYFINDPVSLIIQDTTIAGLPSILQSSRKEVGISISGDYTKELLTNHVLYQCGFVKGWVGALRLSKNCLRLVEL